jgi:hypothetical protein
MLYMFPPGTPICMDYISSNDSLGYKCIYQALLLSWDIYQVMIILDISVYLQAVPLPWTTYQVMIPYAASVSPQEHPLL